MKYNSSKTLFSRISVSSYDDSYDDYYDDYYEDSYQSDDNSIYKPMNCSFGFMNETLDENGNKFPTVEDSIIYSRRKFKKKLLTDCVNQKLI